MNNSKHNRRYFIKSAGLGFLVAFGILWDKLVRTEHRLNTKKTIRFPFKPNKKIDFQGDFIVVNTEGKTTVFSSRCTHLGCTINKMEGNEFICPCHGSAFDIHGDAIKGPAIHALEKKKFVLQNANQQIVIDV